MNALLTRKDARERAFDVASSPDKPRPQRDRHAIGEDDHVRHFVCTPGTDHYDVTFGMRLRMQAVPVYADKTLDDWLVFVGDVVKAVRMTAAHEPVVFDYPGLGTTIVQPIVESVLILDLWDKHKAGYLILATCGGLKTTDVMNTAQKHGVVIGFGMTGEMRLD